MPAESSYLIGLGRRILRLLSGVIVAVALLLVFERIHLVDALLVVARIRAILRRNARGYDAKLTGGDIELDLETKRVLRGGNIIHLGPTEFRLLEHFMRNQGRVYSRDQLLDSVWAMMSMSECAQ